MRNGNRTIHKATYREQVLAPSEEGKSMNPIRQYIIRKRLKASMRPDPEYRERRLAQFSGERLKRALRNIAEIGL